MDTIIIRREIINNLDIPSLPLELIVAEICGEEDQEGIRTGEKELGIKNQELGNKEERKNILSSVIPQGVQREAMDGDAGSRQNISNTGDLAEIESGWAEVLEKIKVYNHSLPFVLNTSKPISFDGSSLVLGIKFRLHKDKIDDPKNKAILTKVLKTVYNKDILINTEIDESLKIDLPGADDEVDVESEFKV